MKKIKRKLSRGQKRSIKYKQDKKEYTQWCRDYNNLSRCSILLHPVPYLNAAASFIQVTKCQIGVR